MINKKSKLQDNEYDFPYHYIPEFRGNFSQTKVWTWGRNYSTAISFILAEIDKHSKYLNSILDVGCGDGRLTKELTADFSNKLVLGVDYSCRAINLAKALNPNVNYKCIDIINEDLGEKFDAITLIEVFEHIPIDLCDKFVESLHELLNENGAIFLTVPHINKPLSYKHYQHFEFEKLKLYFMNHFDIEDVVFFEKLSRWNKIINAILCNKLFILNNQLINNLIYYLYEKFLFYATEKNCGRIYLRLKKKSL